jgi:spore germination cell wall hydrolase CwlJ-like protein
LRGVLVFLLGSFLAPSVAAQTDEQCLRYAVYREARGESVKAMRGVYDVILNRAKLYGKTACQVLKQRGQFPYMRKGKVKKVVDRSFNNMYNTVLMMEAVLNERFLYFNHKRQPWGKHTRKIGKLYFSQ